MNNTSKHSNTKINSNNSGTSKEKATFDQNGKGKSDKFGEAGNKPNESGENKAIEDQNTK